ncbi:RAD23 family protein [Micromonospora musae]|uniref:Uncharacterized protein n=1 Tax=Micromonospora musae TaxID=1894970 RepID=A0A3A9YBR9_9ACTN|nr:hypothetical protein [Micromonospora musae]RKN34742.1 hypothetical protein D7044_08005 [Micromonospora musae]
MNDMEERDVRRLLSTALGTEPPSPFDTAGVVTRGRRTRSRRRLAASSGAVLAVVAVTLPLVVGLQPSATTVAGGRESAPAMRSAGPTVSPSPSRTAVPSPGGAVVPSTTTTPSDMPTGRVVLTAGCATADPSAAADDEHGLPANQPKLMDLYDRVEPVVKRRFPQVYAGGRLANPRDRIELFRKPSGAFDEYVLREFARDCVAVFDARYSAKEVKARADQIMADRPYWAARGITVAQVSFDNTGQVLPVGVKGDVARARAEFPDRYRTGVPIEVSEAAEIKFR